jgi:hypothetical protein
MDRSEIERYVDVSIAHSITIDVCDWKPAPGYVRTITVYRNNRVMIEFQKAHEYVTRDWEGAGLRYVGQYADLDSLVCDLQHFLARSLAEWKNYTAAPYTPKVLNEPDPEANNSYFENAVRRDTICLPGGGSFEVAGAYWRQIRDYGIFRPEKLAEDTDELLRRRGIDPNEPEDD